MLWNFRIQIRNRIQTIFISIYKKKNCTISCLFNVRSSIVSQKVVISFWIFLRFFTFVFHFMLNPDSDPERRIRMHSISGSNKAKSCGSYGSGSTTLVGSVEKEGTRLILTITPSVTCDGSSSTPA